MDKNLKMKKTRYRAKHCIVFMLFLASIIDGISASGYVKESLYSLRPASSTSFEQRTIDVLRVQNQQFNIEKTKLSCFYHSEGQRKNNILISLNKYSHLENSISEFDDHIKYNTVELDGDKCINEFKAKMKQTKVCLRFIKAFGNSAVNKLIISNIVYMPDNSSAEKSIVLSKKHNVSKKVLNVEKIVFRNVSSQCILQILKISRFKEPVEIIFEDNKSYTWDFLAKLSELQKYKRIQICCIHDFTLLNEAQKEKLRKVLSAIVIMKVPHSIDLGVCSELQEILQRSKSNFRRIEVGSYEILSKMVDMSAASYNNATLELTAEDIHNFKPTSLEDINEDKALTASGIFRSGYDNIIMT